MPIASDPSEVGRSGDDSPAPRCGPVAAVLIGLVHVYRRTLAYLMGGNCRFSPTCSVYAIEALRTHGAFRGSWLALRRVCRCHPWGGGGDDPVPDARSASRRH